MLETSSIPVYTIRFVDVWGVLFWSNLVLSSHYVMAVLFSTGGIITIFHRKLMDPIFMTIYEVCVNFLSEL